MKQIKKYIQPVVCVLSLVFLFMFEFIDGDFGYGVGLAFKGITMANCTYFGYLLIILPILLILSSFMPKYEAKKGKWSVVIPAICIISWIVTVLFAKFIMSASESSLSSGAWLTLICYVALLVYGLIFHKDEFDKLIDNVQK